MAEARRSHSTAHVSEEVVNARVRGGAYVVLKDVAGDEGFIDTRIFVRFEMLERIFRDALMRRGFYNSPQVSILSTT